jgi:hypothetical protein
LPAVTQPLARAYEVVDYTNVKILRARFPGNANDVEAAKRLARLILLGPVGDRLAGRARLSFGTNSTFRFETSEQAKVEGERGNRVGSYIAHKVKGTVSFKGNDPASSDNDVIGTLILPKQGKRTGATLTIHYLQEGAGASLVTTDVIFSVEVSLVAIA